MHLTWKKLILIALALVVPAILGSGTAGTGAWFSVVSASRSNILRSGSFDLSVSGGPLERPDLKAGQDYAELGAFCVKNTGSIELKFRGLFETDQQPTGDLLHFTTLRVEKKSGLGWSTPSEIPGSPKIETQGLPFYFKYPKQDPKITNLYVVTGTLAPGQETCYRLSAKLDAAAPESVLDESLPFDLHLYATQASNPGWE